MLSAPISSSPRSPFRYHLPLLPSPQEEAAHWGWGSASLSGSRKGDGPALMGGARHQEPPGSSSNLWGAEWGALGEGGAEQVSHPGFLQVRAGRRHHSSSSSSSSRGGRFRLKKPTWGCTGRGPGYRDDPWAPSSPGRSNDYASHEPA